MKVNVKENLKYNDGSKKYPVKCIKCGTFYNTDKINNVCTSCNYRLGEQKIARP